MAGSFLQVPRINFVGRFRANVATINNNKLNYLIAAMDVDAMKVSWNPLGTNTFELVDCEITSVVYLKDGETVTDNFDTSDRDSAIGLPLVNNPERAFAKIVSVDSQEELPSSSIYGMDLGVNWSPNKKLQENAFIGDFHPTAISRDVWDRQAPSGDPFQQTAASHAVSRIENIKWGATVTSKALKQLKEQTKNNALSINFAMFNFTRPPTENWFTFGNIVGSIGIAEPDESLAFPENRLMVPTGEMLSLPIPKGGPCENATELLTDTYFDVVESKMTIDFSNSLAIGIHGELCQLYPLYVGIYDNNGIGPKIDIIGEIPYMEKNWYTSTAGIQEYSLSKHHQKLIDDNLKVVIVASIVEQGFSHGKLNGDDHQYQVCDKDTSSEKCVTVLLEEVPCLVRPMEYTIHRMEMGEQASVQFKVRHFGHTPKESTTVQLFDNSPNSPAKESDLAYSNIKDTENGIATFNFIAGDVGEPRKDLNLDGQLFTFGYCTERCINDCSKCLPTNEGNLIFFLVWSPIKYSRPYFWDTDVEPIFAQYDSLYPAMRRILTLGDYNDVIKPANIHLLNASMALDISHPSYMPVTRDLSPTKRDMIIEWLNTPNHPRNWEDIDRRLYESPNFCETAHFKVSKSKKSKKKVITNNLGADEKVKNYDDIDVDELPSLANSEVASAFSNVATLPPTVATLKSGTAGKTLHLPGWLTEICTIKSLKESLQTAIALEFSTIPPYMTALYSIKDGYNKKVYSIIRSVVMQEMLHLAQAANLLISIGGQPRMTDPSVSKIPTSFPTHLPGKVLPGLTVTLQKASPKHIANVFMMIEFPDKVVYEGDFDDEEINLKALTIGRFYTAILKCMDDLNVNGSITFGHADKQLHWPWELYDKTSKLWKVTNIKDAREAIHMIVEQGEGSDQLDPTYLGTNKLAHFFKFEELACKHHIQSSPEHTAYDFHGEEIEFVSEGVWPMQNNPSSKNLPKGTQVYHEAKVFHRMYRSLLESIETMFSGHPDSVNDAVYIMESMQMQAKKLMNMSVPVPPGHPNQTCGPIFDYEWEDQE